MTQLSGTQIGAFIDALLDAYPTRDDLRIMVRIELEASLEAIADGANQRVVVFNLITWAERSGRLDDLVAGAVKQNPGNPALRAFSLTWSPATLTPPRPAAPTPTGPAAIDVFLAYSHRNLDAMRIVEAGLRDAGFSVWTDEGLEAGTSIWTAAIEEAVGQAPVMVVLLSPAAKASWWVENEVALAQRKGKRIVPILVDGDEESAVLFRLLSVQRVDGRQELAQAVQRVLARMGAKGLPTTAPVTPAATPVTPAAASVTPAATPVTPAAASVTPAAAPVTPAAAPVTPTAAPVTPTAAPASSTEPAPATEPDPVRRRRSRFAAALERGVKPSTTPDPVRQLRTIMQDRQRPAKERLEAGLQLADLGVLPEGLDDFIAVPGADFRIGKYPVTNVQFRRFVGASGYGKKDGKPPPWWSVLGWQRRQSNDWTAPRLWDYARFNRATQPVVGVSWYEAEAYCAWLNHAHAAPAGYRAQLPTREQWMLAARNGRRQAPADAVDYPWGGGFDPALANTTESGLEQTTPVDMYPDGATKADVFDLAGNVWEWTSDLHSMDRLGDIYWLKGGSFWSSANSARSSAADGDVAWGGSYYGGCRVVVVPISRSA